MLAKRRGIVLGAVFILVLFFIALNFIAPRFAGEGYQRPLPGIPTIAAIGTVPPLHDVMLENSSLKSRVSDLKKIDEAQLFVNFAAVDREIAEIIFLWAGVTEEEIAAASSLYRDPRVEVFLRKAYDLPPEEPIAGNPLLGPSPWPRLFNRFKARLLIQGHGVAIYKGSAVYDLEKDNITVEGVLSKKFFRDFSKFLEDVPDPKPYINNLLVFIDETKGLRRLSDEEKTLVNDLRAIGE